MTFLRFSFLQGWSAVRERLGVRALGRVLRGFGSRAKGPTSGEASRTNRHHKTQAPPNQKQPGLGLRVWGVSKQQCCVTQSTRPGRSSKQDRGRKTLHQAPCDCSKSSTGVRWATRHPLCWVQRPSIQQVCNQWACNDLLQ